jgi:hypothetical protein
MLPRLCVAVAGPAIICGLFSPTNASAQAGTLTAAVSGIAAVPLGQTVDNRLTKAGASGGVRYVPASLADVAIRLDLAWLPTSVRTLSPMYSYGSGAVLATAGPEFDLPAWNGHLYTVASAGVARIWTSMTQPFLSVPAGSHPYTGPTGGTPGATTFAWSGGAGYVTPRSIAGIAADVGVRYYDLGYAAYVNPYFAPEHHRTTFLAPSVGFNWRP